MAWCSVRATPSVESLRDLIEVYDGEIVMLERKIHAHLRQNRGYRAVQAINGVGPTIAAIIVAEIVDVTRFSTARHLNPGLLHDLETGWDRRPGWFVGS